MVRIGSLLFGYRKGYLGYTAKIPFIFLFFCGVFERGETVHISCFARAPAGRVSVRGISKNAKCCGGLLHLFTSIFTRT